MIGICDCEVQAANPNMPLYPLRAYINSPSSLRIRNVPKKIGTWNITSVQLVAAYPDNTIKTANCKLIGCVWVGTIAGSTATGTSENGYTIYASGIDENGNPVSNYVLGKGLVEILEADGTITPGQNTAYVHLLDEEPANPKEGDVWPYHGGYVIWQNGRVNMLGMTETDVREITEPIAADVATLQNDVIGLNNDVGTLTTHTGTLEVHMETAELAIDNINGMIPAQASTSNQLADKAFVNSSVQTATANFRGNWATWADVPTDASLYPADYAGSTTPTVNDYLVVQDASGFIGLNGTWRFKYSSTWATDGKAGWLPEYQVNETPMTAAQLAALNSNITAAKVAQYDDALDHQRYALVDKTPPIHTINNTVTLDDRAINNLELTYDYEVTGWEFNEPSVFAPEGALSWPTWNAANSRWESTGNDGFVLAWNDPESGGEDAEHLTYEDQGGYNSDVNFGKPMKDLVVGDVVTCHTTIYSAEVEYQATVKQSYDDGDGNWAIEVESSLVTLPTGMLVSLTPDFVTGAQNATYSSGEGIFDVAYEAQQLYEEATNVSALEFPPAINGKARDFLIKFVVDNASTIPQFPDGRQTPAAQRVIQYWCSGTTFPTPAKNATSMMYLTEIEPNKFLVRTESIQRRVP